jgi:hypothetical protein
MHKRFDADASPTQAAAICSVASLVSLLFTGSVFGIDNHIFHLPIIHRLYDEDQFRSDAFIQSLRYYSSGIWLLLAGSQTNFGSGHALFHVLLYLSRLLSFVGFVSCGSLVGIRSIRERIIFCLILCFIELLDGTSLAGHGGLFVCSFGHSEVANGTILLAIYFAARAQIVAAVVCAGLTFFINAFMGVWLVLPLVGIVASLIRRRVIATDRLFIQLMLGGIGYAILTAPVAYNILSNPDFGKSLGFDYSEYLRDYFGAHFFLGSNPAYEVLLLLVFSVFGWLALSRLKPGGVEFKAALAGMVALYIIGLFVPLLTKNPMILNLNLLRSGVMIHLLVAMSGAALATKWLTSNDGRESTVLGPYLLFFLCIKYMFPAAGVLVAFENSIRKGSTREIRDIGLRAAILIALGVVVVPWRAWQHFSLDSAAAVAVSEWETIGGWAKSSTAPDSMFLISMTGNTTAAEISASERRQSEAVAAASAVFEATSHRRIWVDFKRGAAVMWSPSYYAQWRPRVEAIQELKTLSETLSFAQRNGIDYIIGDCRAFQAAHIDPVFRTNILCVSATFDAAQTPSNRKEQTPDGKAP